MIIKFKQCKGCRKQAAPLSKKFNGVLLCFSCISKLKKITEQLCELQENNATKAS